jgi:hypothetical protein
LTAEINKYTIDAWLDSAAKKAQVFYSELKTGVDSETK